MAKGALGRTPQGVRISPGVYRTATGQVYQSKSGALGKTPTGKRIPIDKGPAKPPTQPMAPGPGGPFQPGQGQGPLPNQGVVDSSNQYMEELFKRMQEQGNFNPNLPALPQSSDYQAMRQRAEQVAMDSFNRNMRPQFQQEESQFRQRMAEQGIPENSELYRDQYKQLRDQQNAATQNAMSNAFQAGQAEQAQQFGQAFDTRGQMFNEQFQGYQVPIAQAQAMSPYYANQMAGNQLNQRLTFEGQQSELQRQHEMEMARLADKYQRGQMRLGVSLNPRGGGGGGGGRGGMTMADRFALMDREFYNQMVANAMQNGQTGPMPNFGSGFSGGVGAGAGLALGGGLK
jgi:hypothetical protein